MSISRDGIPYGNKGDEENRTMKSLCFFEKLILSFRAGSQLISSTFHERLERIPNY